MGNSHLFQLSNHHICSKLLLSSEKGIPLEVFAGMLKKRYLRLHFPLIRKIRIIRITQEVADHPAQRLAAMTTPPP